jgi:hypothetical protein
MIRKQLLVYMELPAELLVLRELLPGCPPGGSLWFDSAWALMQISGLHSLSPQPNPLLETLTKREGDKDSAWDWGVYVSPQSRASHWACNSSFDIFVFI